MTWNCAYTQILNSGKRWLIPNLPDSNQIGPLSQSDELGQATLNSEHNTQTSQESHAQIDHDAVLQKQTQSQPQKIPYPTILTSSPLSISSHLSTPNSSRHLLDRKPPAESLFYGGTKTPSSDLAKSRGSAKNEGELQFLDNNKGENVITINSSANQPPTSSRMESDISAESSTNTSQITLTDTPVPRGSIAKFNAPIRMSTSLNLESVRRRLNSVFGYLSSNNGGISGTSATCDDSTTHCYMWK